MDDFFWEWVRQMLPYEILEEVMEYTFHMEDRVIRLGARSFYFNNHRTFLN